MESAQPTADSSNDEEHHTKAQEFKNSGNDKFNKNNYKGAIIDYKKGLLHEPDNPDLHANLSAAYIHLEKYLDAEEHAVYTIHLKPNFYKGYMRAAKAAYGKGMTTLALKRINKGLSHVTDPNGVKELNRLKNQYTAYLSLKSNAEREMDFSSDRYISEDEEPSSNDDEDCVIEYSQQVCNHNVPYGEICSHCREENVTRKPSVEITDEITPDTHAPENKLSSNDVSINTKGVTAKEKETALSEELNCESDKPVNVEVPVNTEQNCDENDLPQDNEQSSQDKQPDRFLELCKELTKDPDLNKHVEEFKEHLKTGGEAFLSGNFKKAAESYKAAKERVGLRISDYEIDDRQFHLIIYAQSTALINLGTYEDIVKAIQTLSDMVTYEFSIPALHIQLARAYCKLNRFKNALQPLEKVQEILDNMIIFPSFKWPGTKEPMEETTLTGLKLALKELNQICRMSHKPTATCRYDNCLKTSTHILPSELIFTSDPDFVGFIRMLCEEKCHIEFHIACWKSYKEAVCGIGKVNDKDFLGRPCLTMDCVNGEGNPSVITVVEIIDADGQVKSVNKLDPKTIVDSKKAKKKRSKLDDKEKTVKLKKTKEKKVREVKKPVVVVEEEEDVVETHRANTDTEKELKSRISNLKELRMLNFDKWDPRLPFYGRSDEMEKWVDKCENESSSGQYMEYSNDESVDVRDAKEFIFSYFMEILKVEGPLKQSDVEDLWKEVAEDFCNIKVVLPNLQSMCDLLVESTCFCQLEDYICLAGQLDAAYDTVKTEIAETVSFLMSGSTKANSTPAQSQLPDLLHHPKATKAKQFISPSTSEDESSESEEEYNSDPSESAGESDEDISEIEEVNENSPVDEFDVTIKPPAEEEFPAVKVEEVDGEKFSLQKMLDEMSRVKSMFMKATSEESTSGDKKDQETPESAHNDTFETACGSSQTFSDDDNNLSDCSVEENKIKVAQTDEVDKESAETVISDSADQVDDSATMVEDCPDVTGTPTVTDEQMLVDNAECDKASQIGVSTEERHMQTTPVETKDTLSQTKDSEMYKELNEKVEELTRQINNLTNENAKLTKDVFDKDALNKETKKDHDKIIARLQEENSKTLLKYQFCIKKMKEDSEKENAEFRIKEEKLVNEFMKMKEIHLNLMSENQKLSKETSSMAKQKKALEANEKTLEKNLKAKIISSQQAQLLITKAFWESQVNLLGKRCVEKISEMHSWFSLLPSGEVEELPSWKDVRQITIQWGEISSKIQQIQTEFQTKYNELEARLSRGEEVDDINCLSLPTLPDEPNPLPLDKIHKEITDKHTKKISELTQLVANQQLEIEKIKESSQQFQQLMNPFQITPRMQTPLTTAFGSLAFQYPYPQNLPSQFGSTNIPILPPNQDKMGATKPLQADVQTLLKESTAAKFSMFPPENPSAKGNNTGSILSNSFLSMPPPPVGLPPPPIGVANTLLKTSSALLDKKDKKPVDQPATSKPEPSKAGSSRESTPVAASTPIPTPEKSKKKKKSKADNREEVETKAATPTPAVEVASLNEDTDTAPWSVAVNKKAPKQTPLWPVPTSEHKLKNKKRLLDKLQLKFPTMPLKDLDEIVKLVREQNNGSLSGLPFEEIETRVERFISKKQFQKSSTMGLVKFTEAAWGPVKQQETITWTNLQLEECTICLELMGNDRTKVDCNHEFHTKCLRKWLKEKSVCPLCNKFTTMPDEFPAL